jgi:hypothetical protein
MKPTIESILSQCEEVGDCLEWQGRMQNGSPQVYVGRVNGQSRYRTVRRVFTELLRGAPLPGKVRCTSSCQNARCVAEAHIALCTRKQIAASNQKRGLQSTPGIRAKLTNAARSRPGLKLSIEKAREIRASSLSGPELAKLYGVNRSAIKAVRKGRIWREALQGSSVFSFGG